MDPVFFKIHIESDSVSDFVLSDLFSNTIYQNNKFLKFIYSIFLRISLFS